MTTGENLPGDSEIVALLIVHFQSSIKFNSLSASSCYSNSVTVIPLGYTAIPLFLPPSLPPSHIFVYNETPSSLQVPSSSFLLPSLAGRAGGCVKIMGDREHMCASLWRPTNN